MPCDGALAPQCSRRLSQKRRRAFVFADCVEILRSGDLATCYEILPRICVSRDDRMLPLLREMLSCGDRGREELAICALAALADEEAVPWLLAKFQTPELFYGAGCQRFQTALIDALAEIGSDTATPGLMEIFRLQIVRDNFRRKRQVIVMEALGAIAQQDGEKALAELVLLLDHRDFVIRAKAVSNVTTAFWHRPNDIPTPLFDKLLSLFGDTDYYVQYSLISAMENLADIGCERAAELFSKD